MESNENKLLAMVSLAKEELQSRIIKHGTIFKLEKDEMESANERQLRIFHYSNRGKVCKYYEGAIKNSLIIFRVWEPGR